MMKRISAFFTAFFMAAALTACGGSAASGTSQPAADAAGASSAAAASSLAESESTAAEADSAAASSAASEMTDSEAVPGAHSLVVYFSWSGNTRRVAESIQQQTGSDIFEIVPQTPYSTDYNTVVNDAKAEQQQAARPEIAGSIENIDDYDTVYVGFPNWWGDMPMILYTFFDSYDLSGKTVALFCTSGGSGLSNTVNEVAQLEPNAIVTEGLHIRDNAASAPDDAVSQWLTDIGVVR